MSKEIIKDEMVFSDFQIIFGPLHGFRILYMITTKLKQVFSPFSVKKKILGILTTIFSFTIVLPVDIIVGFRPNTTGPKER